MEIHVMPATMDLDGNYGPEQFYADHTADLDAAFDTDIGIVVFNCLPGTIDLRVMYYMYNRGFRKGDYMFY